MILRLPKNGRYQLIESNKQDPSQQTYSDPRNLLRQSVKLRKNLLALDYHLSNYHSTLTPRLANTASPKTTTYYQRKASPTYQQRIEASRLKWEATPRLTNTLPSAKDTSFTPENLYRTTKKFERHIYRNIIKSCEAQKDIMPKSQLSQYNYQVPEKEFETVQKDQVLLPIWRMRKSLEVSMHSKSKTAAQKYKDRRMSSKKYEGDLGVRYEPQDLPPRVMFKQRKPEEFQIMQIDSQYWTSPT